MPRPAPIAVFAFNRVDHLTRTIASLAACPEAKESALTVYCDGARRPGDDAAVAAVRRYASTIDGFASLSVDASERNRGLAASIMRGMTDQLARSDRVIVLEDDLVVSPHFLRYMNDGLTLYEHNSAVASIHGYVYPVDTPLPETFFLKGADCWGWATWSRAWAHFEADGAALLTRLRERKLIREFDFDGEFPYSGMLSDQIAGRNDSWAILWYASCFLDGLVTLYPGRSLVENIGSDSSGTHCGTTDDFHAEATRHRVVVDAIPVTTSPTARAAFVRFFRNQRSLRSRLRDTVKRALTGTA